MSAKDETRHISDEDVAVLLKYYDKDHDGKISYEEAKAIIADCKTNKIKDAELLKVIEKFDANHDGKIDENEIVVLEKEIFSIADTNARYAGYTAGFARAFRYLAFTSDFGEALRPIVSSRIVTASYAVSIGYCFADVGIEAYKHHKRGYITEHKEPASLTQVIVERSLFQAVASIAVPFALIHTTVDVAKHACRRLGRFQRWGPSIVGLAAVPFLPLYLDEPVEHGLEWVFKRYGPWASHGKTHKD